MTDIERLRETLAAELPGAFLRLDVPRAKTGEWWLDANHQGHVVHVQWSPERGFGVTASQFDEGFGEKPEEVYPSFDEAHERVLALLRHRQRTSPPEPVFLRELRRRSRATQTEIAKRLGVGQAAVSKLERSQDMTLGSLERYVHAIGGELVLRVRVGDEEFTLSRPHASERAERSEEPVGLCCSHVSRLDAAPSEGRGALDVIAPRLEHFLRFTESRVATWLQLAAPPRFALIFHPGGSGLAQLAAGRLVVAPDPFLVFVSRVRARSRPSEPLSFDAALDHAAFATVAHELGHVYARAFLDAIGDPELRAAESRELAPDAFAGWLGAQLDRPFELGAELFRDLGCRLQDCAYPEPEKRAWAYAKGFRHFGRETRTWVDALSLLVLRAGDVERSRSFYAALGLHWRPEKHGTGPAHFSTVIGGSTIEIYPASAKADAHRVRLGLRVSSARNALQRLVASGFCDGSELRPSSEGQTAFVVRDPDGNTVVIEEADVPEFRRDAAAASPECRSDVTWKWFGGGETRPETPEEGFFRLSRGSVVEAEGGVRRIDRASVWPQDEVPPREPSMDAPDAATVSREALRSPRAAETIWGRPGPQGGSPG